MELTTHFPELEPVTSPERLAALLAAIEYTLASSMTLRDASDIQSVQHWSDLFKPYQHQVQNLITFCRLGPVQLIADDVGLGKTISAGLIISELLVRKKIKKVLVIAPKSLLSQWTEELSSKFRIRGDSGTGSQLDGLLRGQATVVVTTYASARTRMNQLAKAGFDMLVLDEAHKLRNLHGSRNPPQMAKEVRRVTSHGAFPFVLLLSATPIQNRLWDLYSLIDILATARNHSHPLGSPSEFAARYLLDRSTARSIKPNEVPNFRRIVSQYMIRTTRHESALTFPEREVQTRRCTPTNVEHRLESILRTHLPRLNRLQKLSLASAMMSSPAAFADQVGNPENQARLNREALDEVRRITEASPLGCKASSLFELMEQLRAQDPDSWRMLIFTQRKATQRELGRAFEARGGRVGYIGGDFGHRQTADIRRFQADPPELNVIVSTDTGAEGLNLQAANVVVNYDLPWNPMVLEQRVGRVQRLGSKHSHVVVSNLVVRGSVEELVVARLLERLQLISHAIGDIEGILGTLEDEEDLETKIEELVLLSLAGHDVEVNRLRIEESIKEAKRLYDESLALVNESLGSGSMDALHRSGPSAPVIATVQPRLTVHDLVRVHFAGRGEVTELDNGRLKIRERGSGTHYATFNANDPILKDAAPQFGGRPTRFYAEGEHAFERIVGANATKRLHNVVPKDLTERELTQLSKDWISRLSSSLTWIHVKLLASRTHLTGRLAALVTSGNALDRLQRLVEVVSPEGGWQSDEVRRRAITPFVSGYAATLKRESLPSSSIAALESAVQNDPSVRAFNEFYEARLTEELGKSGDVGNVARRLEERFRPRTTAELISAEGILNCSRTVQVGYRYAAGATGVATLVIDGTGKVVAEPSLSECELSRELFPEGDLSTCAVTGKRALTHLMAICSISSSRMLPEVAVKCTVSGDTLLPSEAVESEFSHRLLSPKCAVQCDVSGKIAAIDEVGTCAFTGSIAHADHLAVSQVSACLYRADQQDSSVVSGTTGHASEFVKCELTRDSVLPKEVAPSSASGKLIRRDRLIPSQKNPTRLAAELEMVRCVVTNKLLIPDETGVSDLSGRVVDIELLAPSSWSGKLGLQDELLTCEVSGARILTTEAIRSAFSSKVLSPEYAVKCEVTEMTAASDEVTTCEFTGATAHVSQVAVSEVSERRYRADQRDTSAVSGLSGHRSEFNRCALTGDSVLPSEAGISAVSGKLMRLDRLFASSRDPDRLAAREEMVRCAISGMWFMPDEVGISAISGLVVNRNLLIPSALSNSLALADELFTCEESLSHVLPAETGTCHITGKRVRQDLLGVSDVSGVTLLKRLLRRCPETALHGTESEFVRCDVSGLLVSPTAVDTCTLTGKTVIRRLLVDCAECHLPLLRSEAAVTGLGEHAHPLHTAVSHYTGRRYLPRLLERCRATGLLLESEYLEDGISKLLQELAESAYDGRPIPSSLVDQASQLIGNLNPPIMANKVWAKPTPKEHLVAVVVERRRFLRQPEVSAFYLDVIAGTIIGDSADVRFTHGRLTFTRN